HCEPHRCIQALGCDLALFMLLASAVVAYGSVYRSRFVYATVIRGGGERLGEGLPLCLCYCHPRRWRKAWERAPALFMLLSSAEVVEGLGNSTRVAYATVIRGGGGRIGKGLPLRLCY